MIKRQRLADDVAEALRREVREGRYKPGERLPNEQELMAAFGVGRSSIREAVRILAHSGILRVQQGLGTFVEHTAGIMEPLGQRLRRSGAEDLNEVRQLLEAKIAEKAASHRTSVDIRKMRELLSRRIEVAHQGDKASCIEADVAFHVSIAEAAGNEVLLDLYKTFAVQVARSLIDQYTDTSSFIQTHGLHEKLLQAIVDRNAKEAWNLAKNITDRKE